MGLSEMAALVSWGGWWARVWRGGVVVEVKFRLGYRYPLLHRPAAGQLHAATERPP